MFTYFGWNSLCYVTEEMEDYTSISLATVYSVIFVTVSYLIINVAYVLGKYVFSYLSNKINLLFRQMTVLHAYWFSEIYLLNPTSKMQYFLFKNHLFKSFYGKPFIFNLIKYVSKRVIQFNLKNRHKTKIACRYTLLK